MSNRIMALRDEIGLAGNADIQIAIDGFVGLGYEITLIDKKVNNLVWQPNNKMIVRLLNLEMTKSFILQHNPNFKWIEEQTILPFMRHGNRAVQIMTTKELIDTYFSSTKIKSHLFVKPVETKLFDGIVIDDEQSLHYFKRNCGGLESKCIVSSVLVIKSEFRCFVHHHELVDIRHYKGDFRLIPSGSLIEHMIAEIKALENAPVAYTIDVMINDDDITRVIEVNDFWCIGNYGLQPELYATMLKDRWSQIFS